MNSSVRLGRSATLAAGTAFALRVALPLAAALLAAIAAHVTLDAIGDFVLAHDAFDDHAHGSRLLASTVLGAAGLAALWTLARAVVAEARGSRGALQTAVHAALPPSPAVFGLTVAAAVLPLLAAMAWLDALAAGAGIDDVADLFGGSIPLGAGVALAFAFATARGLHSCIALLARHHRAIVRAAEAFVRPASAATGAPLAVTPERGQRRHVAAVLARSAGGNRAPPRPALQTLTA
jgi:hypothetical protein